MSSAELFNSRRSQLLISDLIGSSPKFRAMIEDVETVASADCAVLIRGETGTGKEVIAQAIHGAAPVRGDQLCGDSCRAARERTFRV
jgi:transcriptional regulator with GAF, ATPase, and Fis domain